MNYLKEIIAFQDEVELNSLSSSASLLWYKLMHFNNKTGWKEEFTVPTAAILVKTGLPESSFLRARRELAEKGYITYQPGTRNQAPTYHMISQVKEQTAEPVAEGTAEEVKEETEDRAAVLFKRKEEKGKEGVVGAGTPHSFYEQNLGMLTPFMAEKVTDWCERLSDELVMESMKIAVRHNKLFFHYCEGILKRWEKGEIRSMADVKRMEKNFTLPLRKKDERPQMLQRMFETHRKGSHL
ncbi:DnaD domain-containing protein [Halobacillus sp. A5]|uniref:DnaD domain-containing protein n=1 Tax=Halobacillus sp. A5 TaxID=2880263 RepID=UPI0020A646B5|nr:DnaD domain protein [Halobacillus sp. A5]MCP3027631.1 DnaD domain protein [Halobacillus sp. A5]